MSVVSVDKDGKMIYSSIEQVKIDKAVAGLHVYPNPAKDIIVIEAAKARQVMITDAAGRMILTQQFAGQNTLCLNLSFLAKGIYMVKVFAIDNVIVTQKLLVD